MRFVTAWGPKSKLFNWTDCSLQTGELAALPLVSTDELFDRAQQFFWHFVDIASAAALDGEKSAIYLQNSQQLDPQV